GGLRPAVVLVQLIVRRLVPGGGLGLQLFSVRLDLVFLFFVAVNLALVGDFFILRRQVTGKFGQRLLGALGLEVIPLVGRFCFLDGRIVFIKACVGLRGPAHVGKNGPHRGNDGRDDSDLRDHAAAIVVVSAMRGLSRMLQLMVVWPVYIKSGS